MTETDNSHLPNRKWLNHSTPLWVGTSPNYFITLCCEERTSNQLCSNSAGSVILDAAHHYHESHKWYLHILLLMPDHIHAIVCLPPDGELTRVMADFKKFTARQTGISWQKGFFEHRLRNDESLDEKVSYILNNPVRKALANSPEEWPWKYHPSII
jgi:REP element-mobilizing transposase RayT